MPRAQCVPAHPAVMEAEEVQPLTTFLQVHDPRLGLLKLKAKLPGALTVLSTQIDLASADLPTYLLGETDHIVRRQNAYRATQILGGTSRFVLVNSGHIQALVNPPDPNSRRKYRVARTGEPEAWLAEAAEHNGSWWPDYLAWLEPRSGELKPKPKSPGSKEHKPLASAPGTYVFET